MNSPSISIIIPIYNAKKYLRDCFGDIIAQTYTDWECILVDDGSTDGSGAICDEYAAADRRIRVIHKENGGVSSARNCGIDNAKGEWITFIDADDKINPDFLKNLIVHENTETELIVGGNTYFGLEFGETIPPENIIIPHDKFKEYIFKNEEWTWQRVFYVVWGKLFRKSTIQQNELKFNTSMSRSEDTTFILLFMTKIKSVTLVKSNDYSYRYESSAKSYYEFTLEKFKAQHKAYKSVMDIICKSGIGDFSHIMNRSRRQCFNLFLSSMRNKKELVRDINNYKEFEKDHTYLFCDLSHTFYYKTLLHFPSIWYFINKLIKNFKS